MCSNEVYHTHFYFNILSLAAKISARWLHCHKHRTCSGFIKLFLEGSGVLNRQEYSFYIDGPPPGPLLYCTQEQFSSLMNPPMLFHRQLFSSNSHWCALFISRNQSITRLISFQKHDEKTTVFRDHCFQEFGPWRNMHCRLCINCYGTI